MTSYWFFGIVILHFGLNVDSFNHYSFCWRNLNTLQYMPKLVMNYCRYIYLQSSLSCVIYADRCDLKMTRFLCLSSPFVVFDFTPLCVPAKSLNCSPSCLFCLLREQFLKANAQLTFRCRQLLYELSYIYPIDVVSWGYKSSPAQHIS